MTKSLHDKYAELTDEFIGEKHTEKMTSEEQELIAHLVNEDVDRFFSRYKGRPNYTKRLHSELARRITTDRESAFNG